MKTILAVVLLFGVLWLCAAGVAMAQDPKAKGPACEEQLAQAQTHANLVGNHRSNLEAQLAVLATELTQERKRAAALQRELDALKKPSEKKAE